MGALFVRCSHLSGAQRQILAIYTMNSVKDNTTTAVPQENHAPQGVCPHCGKCPTCGRPHNPYANPYPPTLTWEWRPDIPYTQPYFGPSHTY